MEAFSKCQLRCYFCLLWLKPNACKLLISCNAKPHTKSNILFDRQIQIFEAMLTEFSSIQCLTNAICRQIQLGHFPKADLGLNWSRLMNARMLS